MKKMNRFGAAFLLAGMIAAVMAVTPARVEAKKRNPGDPLVLFCQSLQAIIDYQYTSPVIRDYAQQLFAQYNCADVLANQ